MPNKYSWVLEASIKGSDKSSLIARFMGPTWGPSGADRTQVGPMLAPWTLLSGMTFHRILLGVKTFACPWHLILAHEPSIGTLRSKNTSHAEEFCNIVLRYTTSAKTISISPLSAQLMSYVFREEPRSGKEHPSRVWPWSGKSCSSHNVNGSSRTDRHYSFNKIRLLSVNSGQIWGASLPNMNAIRKRFAFEKNANGPKLIFSSMKSYSTTYVLHGQARLRFPLRYTLQKFDRDPKTIACILESYRDCVHGQTENGQTGWQT